MYVYICIYYRSVKFLGIVFLKECQLCTVLILPIETQLSSQSLTLSNQRDGHNSMQQPLPGLTLYTLFINYSRNAGDREKVWTFGGGPRQCIGRYLSSTLLRVRKMSDY